MSLQSAPLAFTASEIRAYYSVRIPKLSLSDHAEWRCACPIHQGRRDSFAIHAQTGQWYCHSDCSKGGSLIDFEMEISGASFLEAKRRVYEIIGTAPPPLKVEPITRKRRPDWMKPVEFYPYQNLGRELKYQTIRLEGIDPDDGEKKKDFSQRIPDRAAGKWTYKEPPDTEKILYRWSDWHTSVNVLITEGERNANSLWSMGFPATAALGGCKRPWLPQYTAALQGKRVAVFQDNDDEIKAKRGGQKWSLRVARALYDAGIYVKLLPVVPLDVDNPHGQDITDWIAAGAKYEDIVEFVKSALVFTPPVEIGPVTEPVDPTAEARASIDVAFTQNDLGAIFKLIPDLIDWPLPEVMALIARMHKEFGRAFSKRDFLASIKAAKAARRAKEAKSNDGPLPTIIVNNRPVRDITMDGLKALRAANSPPVLFMRSTGLSYIQRDDKNRPIIADASVHHIRGRLDRSANYVRATEDGDLHIPVPIEVVNDVVSLPVDHLAMPTLAAVSSSPFFRPNGTIVDQPGYDTSTGIYYVPPDGFDMEPVPEKPDGDDIRAAIDTIDGAFCDFPFVDEASRTNLIGLLLSIVLRPAINGCIPIALIDAPDAGTGKTLLVKAVAAITTGLPAALTPPPETEEEWRKQIAASLLDGRQIVCFDNVESTFSGKTLNAVITTREVKVRLLGTAREVLLPNDAIWIVTGNNIRPAGDIVRRCYQIRMDAQTPLPYMTRSFRHEDLVSWIDENRAGLLRSLLTIGRAWFTAGCPRPSGKPMGSFESFYITVGGTLQNAGLDKFFSNISDLQQADEDAIQWEGFLLTLVDRYPDEATFSVSDLINRLRSGDEGLSNALPDYLGEAWSKGVAQFKQKLGVTFNRRREKKFGARGIHIRKMGMSSSNSREWAISLREM